MFYLLVNSSVKLIFPYLVFILQDSGVRYISAGIAEQQEGLHVLNVSTNNLTQDGIHHISAMLVGGLHTVCLSPGCHFYMYILFRFLFQPCTKSLRELNISNNRFGDPGLFMLKLGVLANRSVEKLLLSGTKITCEGNVGHPLCIFNHCDEDSCTLES